MFGMKNVKCGVCFIISPCKLSSTEKQQLNTTFEKYTFTWGSNLSDLEIPGRLSEVCVFLNCSVRFYSPVRILSLLASVLTLQLLRPPTSLQGEVPVIEKLTFNK